MRVQEPNKFIHDYLSPIVNFTHSILIVDYTQSSK